MWILENEGDALNGKQLWLRPGKKFLFGRTKGETGDFAVSDKTISRQHLTVEVEQVPNEQCGNPRSRSKLTLEDLKTKIGTLLNGDQIRGTKVVLEKDDNVVTLGKYKHKFRFTWIPVTFTFSFTAKEQKADPYTSLYNLLGPLDIKVVAEYEHNQTTHVVAKKRNTAKGLQALIDGKYIVHNDTFIKAVVAAAMVGEEGPSPLEEDFAANFPEPLQYLPPKSDEPTQRESTAYAPNPVRRDMFDGYTFVFYERRQFDTLLAPITQGRGKALFREVIPNETTVDDFVRYVKGVAGEKGLGEFEDGSEGKGVVVVRFNPVKGFGSDWFAEFSRGVALHLDHRLVEQNEFLDAILGNDASVLRRPLEIEPSGVGAPPQTAATAMTSQTLRSSEQAPAPTPAQTSEVAPPETGRRGRTRRTGRAQFKGFDDDFSGPVNFGSVPPSMEIDAPPANQEESQSLFVSQNPSQDYSYDHSQSDQPPPRVTRKRLVSQMIIEEEDEDIMETMAPAAAKLKRQRLARGESTPPPQIAAILKPKPPEKLAPSVAKKGKKTKEIEPDLLELARQQREKAGELAKAEREALEEQLEGMDINQIRNLAVIEEMEVSRAPRAERASRADDSDRWDDRWNGRKNFKRFRRRGADTGRGPEKKIVELVEVKKKDFGVGDEYWGEDTSLNPRRKKGKDKDTEAESQDPPPEVIAQTKPKSQPKPMTTAAQEATRILAADAEALGILDNSDSDLEIVEPPTRQTRNSSQRTQTLTDKTRTTQNMPPSSPKKRAAETLLTKEKPPKRSKPTPAPPPVLGGRGRQKAREVVVEDSDDSDDELKFRFKPRT